jgi:hypothetical protein
MIKNKVKKVGFRPHLIILLLHHHLSLYNKSIKRKMSLLKVLDASEAKLGSLGNGALLGECTSHSNMLQWFR